MEEWRTVPNFDNYMVSSYGRVKSIRDRDVIRDKMLSVATATNGYRFVNLYKDGKGYHKNIHRLVAVAFIDNPENLEMVNHKDEDKSNNHVDNLEWCSRSYNQLYSMKLHPERNKTFGDNFKRDGKNTSPNVVKGLAHKHKEPIIQKTIDGQYIAKYDSAAHAASVIGCEAGNIYASAKRNADVNRRRKTESKSHGYIWEFE